MPELITSSALGTTLTTGTVLLCTSASLLFGLGVAGTYMVKNRYNKGFVVTLVLLPAIVQIVIMMVNGNVGTGVAVAGAFSLVRFRSVAGSARDIVTIFFAMAIGLATGMGYLFCAALFLAVIGLASVLLFSSKLGDPKEGTRVLRITIPENLDYESLFDDLFEQYTRSAVLDRIKTTNMGSLYELSYRIELNSHSVPKAFIDQLRCRNGNLNIAVSRPQPSQEEL